MIATQETHDRAAARTRPWSERPALQATALAASAMFAGGGLLTQTVIVPFWRSGGPQEALDRFAAHGPVTGATLFPIEMLSVVLLGVIAAGTWRRRQAGRVAWTVAFVAMVGTVLLLPVYFLGANDLLLTRSVTGPDVDALLATWHAWNWGRTVLALVATVACCAAARPRTANGRP